MQQDGSWTWVIMRWLEGPIASYSSDDGETQDLAWAHHYDTKEEASKACTKLPPEQKWMVMPGHVR